jgi:hypothetical protein
MYFSVSRPFDDGRARGRGAQAFFLHRFAQLVVVDLLARALHGAQQRGFGVACRGLGLEALGLGLFRAHHLAGLDGHEVLALVAVLGTFHFVGRFLAVNGQPAGLDQHLALGLEVVLLHLGDARGHLVFGAREEHRHEAAHHQVVELLLRLGQAVRRLRGGDDGEVVADLAVVEDAFAGAHVVAFQRLARKGCQVGHARVGQHFKGLACHAQVVLGQGARIGTRVGQGLVALVQALRQGERGLGAEKPNLPLASRCRLVRSNSRGEACVVGLLSSVTLAGWPRTASAI